MAGDDGRGCFSCRTVAVMLVLSSLAKPYTCFSLLGLNENVKQDKVFGEATTMEVKTGIVLFNGREIRSRPWSASAAATGSDGLLHIDSYLSDGTGMLEQKPAVKGAMVNEAAWRHMKPSLHCGGDQLKFRVVGPGASQFALEQENAPPIPLSQVPSSCGYSMQKNSLALVLLVPYDGCNMVQEGENYILSLLWRGIPISLCCQNLMAHTLTTAAPTSPAKPEPTAPPATAGATTSAPVTETAAAATTTKPNAPLKKPEMPVFPNFPYFYPPMFPYFQPPPALATVTPAATSPPITETAATATTKPVAPMKKPEMPVFPNFPYYPPMFPYFQPPPALATSPPITETAATATTKPVAPMKKPEMPVYPNFPYFYPSMFPYFQPPQALATVTPATTSPPITETAATATTKPVAPMQKPEMPVFPNFPYYPPMFPYFQPPPPAAPAVTAAPAATEVPTTTAEPTTATTTKSTTTTINSANPSETDPIQMFPFPFPPYIPQYPWPFPESLPAMSKLQSPAFPPHMAALGHYPHYMFPPHALPASTQNPPLKPEPALPTTMPTTNPDLSPAPLSDSHPQGQVAVEFFPFGNPFGPSPF